MYDFVHTEDVTSNSTNPTSSVVGDDYLNGAIYVPSDHIQYFEELMTPLVDDYEFDTDEGRHRALGSSIRWCRYCDLGTNEVTHGGGCYYRRDLDGYLTYKRYLEETKEEGEEGEDEEYDATEISTLGGISIHDERELGRKRKKKWHCYDAWKKGSFRG